MKTQLIGASIFGLLECLSAYIFTLLFLRPESFILNEHLNLIAIWLLVPFYLALMAKNQSIYFKVAMAVVFSLLYVLVSMYF